jgi:hypothetical protein
MTHGFLSSGISEGLEIVQRADRFAVVAGGWVSIKVEVNSFDVSHVNSCS